MNRLAMMVSPRAIWPQEIRSGMFRGLGTRHVLLAVLFALAYDVLGQLGWIDFGSAAHTARLNGLAHMPIHVAIAFVAILAAVAAENMMSGDSVRMSRYVVAVLIASIAGTLILELLAASFVSPTDRELAALLDRDGWRFVLLAWNFLKALYICIVVVALHAVFEANRRAGATLHAARIAALDAEHDLFEGELRAMQTRVEPGLLFDSLRDVDTAYGCDPAFGQSRLDILIRFLRAALPGSPATASTVAHELELTEAYVELAATGTSPNVRSEFIASPATLNEKMPPMLMLPLVRWALAGDRAERLSVCVKQLDVRAGHSAPCLEIAVENQMINCARQPDEEAETVRDRLVRLYGADASLQISVDGNRRRAVVELPLSADRGSKRDGY